MWCVQATVETVDGEWQGVRQVPTFYLDERVQGILSDEHAKAIALDVLTASGTNESVFHIAVGRV